MGGKKNLSFCFCSVKVKIPLTYSSGDAELRLGSGLEDQISLELAAHGDVCTHLYMR